MKLYGKLIFWFLLANVVAVAVTVLVSARLWMRSYTEDDATRDGQAAVQVYESQGADALEKWLHQRRRSGVFGMLTDDHDRPLARAPAPFLRHRFPPPAAPGEPASGPAHFEMEVPPDDDDPEAEGTVHFRVEGPPPPGRGDGIRRGPMQVFGFDAGPGLVFGFRREEPIRTTTITSSQGKTYRWTAVLGPPHGRRAHLIDLALHLSIGLIAIAVVALLAARAITRPIGTLRAATHDLAEGRLQTRVPAAIVQRGDELGVLGRSFNDMAERLQRLLESQRQLLRDVSHELRSPLARLRIASELARGDSAAAHFDRIEQEAGRLEELIGQVLLIARLESPQSMTTREPVDVTDLARQVCEDAQLEAQPRNVVVQANLRNACTVAGRPELLQSAIENVVRNAVRYTADGTTVEVEAACEEKRWRIVVADRGPGVPANQLDAIFKPFHRVSSARDRDSGGYGLGLAIAERAVSAHGGSIAAQNREGGGLRVEIILPIA